MRRPETKEQVEAISLLLTTEPTDAELVDLADADMKRFSGVDPIYNSLKRIFGDRVTKRVLDGATIRIYVKVDETSDIPFGMKEFHDGLTVTARELKENAGGEELKRHTVALKSPALVPALQAFARGKSTHGLDVSIEFGGSSHGVPELRPLDFAEPDADYDLRKSGSFHICGLLRDDLRGHQLIVTDNQLRVHLPPNDPEWSWKMVHDVLERSTHLVATLRRATKSAMWTVGDNARLEGQPNFAGMDAESG